MGIKVPQNSCNWLDILFEGAAKYRKKRLKSQKVPNFLSLSLFIKGFAYCILVLKRTPINEPSYLISDHYYCFHVHLLRDLAPLRNFTQALSVPLENQGGEIMPVLERKQRNEAPRDLFPMSAELTHLGRSRSGCPSQTQTFS